MTTDSDASDETQTSQSAPEGAASSTPGVIAEIEGLPLAERAAGYQALADELRTQLEQSDPSLRT
ncbi:hypothetical protein [Agromyces laixinhei]|uniref:hypothetical protein n=1 Tax=Agromyces laixinhei TaxID=2585717 RepID=UPI0011161719|nr:hypothetical protein [Agromyces laixinhei]